MTFRQLKIANMDAESATVDPIQSLHQLFPQLDEFRQQKGLPPAPEKLEGVYTTLDQWDGFQAERRRITQRFRDDATFSGAPGVENLVTIIGDPGRLHPGELRRQHVPARQWARRRGVSVRLHHLGQPLGDRHLRPPAPRRSPTWVSSPRR